MKNKKCIIALIAAFMLSGCDSVFEDEYIADYEHYYDTTEKTTESAEDNTDEPDFIITENTESVLPEEEPQKTDHGNAASISGRTVLVSIFANDTETSWDYESEEDVRTMYETVSYLGIAADWLENQVALYSGNAEFVFDWETNQDLFYGANFYEKMAREDSTFYDSQKYFIDSYIDSELLKEKYGADNILYLFFFDTDYSNQANSCASPPTSVYGNYYSTEFINIHIRYDDTHIASPSVYAHEILHTFGAHDLYYENTVITEEYVNFCKETGSNDIMYTVSDGEAIINELSELDAYYIGLVDSSEDAEKWGLLPSEFE